MKKICLLLALVFAAAAPLAALAQDAAPGPQLGTTAPALAAKTLGGRHVTLGDYRGKVLVLNFWATWCPPCRAETPDMVKAFRQLAGPNVAFLGVDSTETAPIIRAFVATKGLPYPVAIDFDKKTSAGYDVRGIPTTYVIDAAGIVRARFVDVVTVEQLVAFVNAAKAGQNGVVTSAAQTRIDAALNPAQFSYPPDRDGVLKTLKAVNGAIDSANRLLGEASVKGETTDYLKMRAEEATLEGPAVAALAKIATSPSDRALLYRIQGDLATNTENWADAIAAYKNAVALGPKDQDALNGLAFAYYEQKSWREEIAAYQQVEAIGPDADTYIEIGKAYLQLKEYPSAVAADRKAVDIAVSEYAKKKTSETITDAAYTWLYLGRAFVAAGDSASAHAAFTQTVAYGQQLPRNSANLVKYTEEGQEADVSLGLEPSGKTTVSLAPWTGADLPGSIASTMKYRLVVAARAGSSVSLVATGLSKGWLASFCSDKICAPMQRTAVIPASGVKIFEFQLIPNDPHAAAHTKVQVRATSLSGNAVSSTVVATK